MRETEEIKLRALFFETLFNYFSDNLPAHLFPEPRIKSTVYDILDLLIDDYDKFKHD